MNFVFDPSLVLYLPLHELDSAAFMSRDAYGHTCTVTGALWRPNGHYFDGTDDRITADALESLKLTDTFTVEYWVNLDSSLPAQHQTALSLGDNPISANRITFTARRNAAGNRVAVFNTNTPAWYQSTASLSPSDWHHVMVVVEGAGGKIYFFVDNMAAGSPASAVFPALDGDLVVGMTSDGSGERLKGLIGEVRIYNRGLTPQEIQYNYLATKWRYR